jgi:rRNA maturation endonuclease Nob1
MLKTAVTFICGALISAPIYYYVFDNNLEETPVNKIERQIAPSLKIEQPSEVTQALNHVSNEQALLDKISILEQQLADERKTHKAEIAKITAEAVSEVEKHMQKIELDAQQQLNAIMNKLQNPSDNHFAEQHLAQNRDSNWAEQTEAQIQDFFATHDYLEHITLNKIDCRQTLCKINYNISDKLETPHLFEHQLKNAPWHKKFGSSHSSKANGKVILFVEKQNSEQL